MQTLKALHVLDVHCVAMQKAFSHKDVFCVGGCVRDLLLAIEQSPQDIDVTLSAKPETLFNAVSKTTYSAFKTEKFGTITLIPKKSVKQPAKNVKSPVQYEITPFRLEWKYDDFRHPGEIQRTNDLVADATRRDFTINCLYYTAVSFDQEPKSKNSKTQLKKSFFSTKELEEQGWVYDFDAHVLIIQDVKHIQTLFENWQFNTRAAKALLRNTQVWTNKEPLGVLIDPYKGLTDMMNRKLKAVNNPDMRFQEDALRIIRALRIVNVLNDRIIEVFWQEGVFFDIDTPTRRSLKRHYYLIQYVAKERIRVELVKVFKRRNPFWFVALLDEANLLKYLFPSLHSNKNVSQPVRYHPFDVYTHTMLVLYHMQQYTDSYCAKLWALFHDVGKAEQYYAYGLAMNDDERRVIHGSWLNHVNCGADFAKRDLDALGFSRKEIDEVVFYVQYHMKPGEILMAKREHWTKKIRSMLSEHWYEKMLNLLKICKADRAGQYNDLQAPSLHQVDELIALLEKLYKNEGQFTLKQLGVNGNDLMKHFKLKPGPAIKELLDKALERVSANISVRNNKKLILEHLKTSLN